MESIVRTPRVSLTVTISARAHEVLRAVAWGKKVSEAELAEQILNEYLQIAKSEPVLIAITHYD